jgi:L-fuconate dehydratase
VARIRAVEVIDVRFPTSRELAGSDAMNPEPDYSAAYVVLRSDDPSLPEGHGFTFTIGRGTEVCVAAVNAMAPLVVGLEVDEMLADLGGFARRLSGDSQLRWLGPEKGVVQLATAAVVNAAWDLKAKVAGLPLWQVLARMTPEELVDLVDWRYLSDALTRDEAVNLLRAVEPGRAARERELLECGFPAYTTSPGWLGYDDDKLVQLCREAVADGFGHVKLKVGADLEEDLRRCGLARAAIGPDVLLSVDANQRWEIDEAIDSVLRLKEFDLYWVEEPTSPDDVAGHAAIARAVAPVRVATGEHVANRVVFKQLLAGAAIDVCQIDACRVAGVNENVAILLLAAKFGVPVCPHAGGVGLCEVVQHLSMFDFVAVSGTMQGRWIEYVDHLHEHFVDPVRVSRGAYRAPEAPGSGAQMWPASLAGYQFPDGPVWSRDERARNERS